MYLDKLSLLHFRNHTSTNLEFGSPQIVIVAPNGTGKTNILEAIYLLSTAESFRNAKAEEMVEIGNEVAHIAAKVSNPSEESTNLQLTLNTGLVQGRRVQKKKQLVNGVSRTKRVFVGNLPVVVFRPEDMRLVEGSPSRRREFLDETLTQTDKQYGISLSIYSKAIRQRNKLLEMIRDHKTHPRALEYWDNLVIKHGTYLQTKRKLLIDEFNQDRSAEILNFGNAIISTFSLEYDHSLISWERIEQYRQQELASAHTLVGPHRDDFYINYQIKPGISKNLQIYGSRGQQRLGVLWLKIQAMIFITNQIDQRPILLLDDIFSELDQEHRELVFELMNQQQTIATTADTHYVDGITAQVIHL